MLTNLKKQKVVLWGTHHEKHIRTLCYSAENNRMKTGRQTRKRETKTNMGRRSKILDWPETINREHLKGDLDGTFATHSSGRNTD